MRTIVPIDTELVSTPAPAHHHIALFRAGDSIYAVTEEGDFVATPVAPLPDVTRFGCTPNLAPELLTCR